MSQPEWARLQFELKFTAKSWIYDAMGRHTAVPPNVDYYSPPDKGLPGEVDYFDYVGPRIDEAMSIYRQHPPWGGGHDEATWVGSWFGYYRLTGDKRVKEFLYFLRDGFLAWGKRNLYHGFWPRGEIHHHMETFTSWLCHYWKLKDDLDTDLHIVEDAAHHLGNWVEGIPEWYDWKRHAFRSWWLGTKVVLAPGPEAFDALMHTRALMLALDAYKATQKEQYLTLLMDWMDEWCRLIVEAKDTIPAVRLPIDDPAEIKRIYGEDSLPTQAWRYHNKIGDDWESCYYYYEHVGSRYMGHMASMIEQLYPITRSDLHMAAWEKLAQLAEKADPDGAPGIALAYRRFHGDTRYDEKLRRQAMTSAEAAKDEPLPTIIMKEFSQFGRYMPARIDWAHRTEDGTLVQTPYSPGAFLTAYNYTGELAWAKRCMEGTIRTAQMAMTTLRDGREHGCGAGSRIAGPGGGALGTLRSLASGDACLSYYDLTHRRVGLPETMAALVKPGKGQVELSLYNDAERDVELQIEFGKGGDISALSVDGVPSGNISLRFANVLVPAGKEVQVTVQQAG